MIYDAFVFIVSHMRPAPCQKVNAVISFQVWKGSENRAQEMCLVTVPPFSPPNLGKEIFTSENCRYRKVWARAGMNFVFGMLRDRC